MVSGEHRSPNDMFFQATNQFDDWKDLIPNEPRKTVELAVNLGGFYFDTSAGAVEMISVSQRRYLVDPNKGTHQAAFAAPENGWRGVHLPVRAGN